MTTRDDRGKPRPMEKPQSDAAKDRLAAALRENLKKRKAQARGREAPAADLTDARDAAQPTPAKSPEDR